GERVRPASAGDLPRGARQRAGDLPEPDRSEPGLAGDGDDSDRAVARRAALAPADAGRTWLAGRRAGDGGRTRAAEHLGRHEPPAGRRRVAVRQPAAQYPVSLWAAGGQLAPRAAHRPHGARAGLRAGARRDPDLAGALRALDLAGSGEWR